MKWYFEIAGGHTHVRVFLNGAKCGDLCFRNEEFDQIRATFPAIVFVKETMRSRLDWYAQLKPTSVQIPMPPIKQPRVP